jgi:DNA-binding transcriptional MerR regulator
MPPRYTLESFQGQGRRLLGMRIGEVAAKAGVSTDTVRHYERLGLLPKAPRGPNGYRHYSDTAVRRVLTIRSAVQFGFPLKDLRGFLESRAAGRPPCADVRAQAARLLSEVDARIRDLQGARRQMRRTLADWDTRLSALKPGQAAGLLDLLPTPRKR